MQEELIKRAKELLADGTVARVLGWKAGDLPYNPEPSYFENEDQLKNFVYNGFCGANLSKYMIEASKLEGKTLVFLKPCDTYSFNQLIKEHPEILHLGDDKPLQRIGRVEDCMGPAVFLASHASDFMTGQIVYADGGMTAIG